jgi:hypothetical protein
MTALYLLLRFSVRFQGRYRPGATRVAQEEFCKAKHDGDLPARLFHQAKS